MQAKAREFHKSDALLAGRESLSPHNTIDGVVMLAKSSGPRLLGSDNGEAGPRGQRPAEAFPESFAGVRRMFAPCSSVILRSRALARRLEGSPHAIAAHPSRLAVKNGEHLRMTAVVVVENQLFSSGLISFSKSS